LSAERSDKSVDNISEVCIILLIDIAAPANGVQEMKMKLITIREALTRNMSMIGWIGRFRVFLDDSGVKYAVIEQML
jgi:hypothetical protein